MLVSQDGIEHARRHMEKVRNLGLIRKFSRVMIDGAEHSVEQVFGLKGLTTRVEAVQIDHHGQGYGKLRTFDVSCIEKVLEV